MNPRNTGTGRLLSLVVVLFLVACGGDVEGATSTSTSMSISTAATSTTTTIPAMTTSTLTTSTSGVVTTIVETVEVATVVKWIQQWLEDDFGRSDPPEGATGAYQLECDEPGLIAVGGVFACAGIPQTEPDFQLDPVGVVIYVLNDSGMAVWTEGTDVPDTADGLFEAHDQAQKGLFCRNLLSSGGAGGLFNGSGRPPEDAFFWSLVYWSLEGEPDGMDEDWNGVPCETLYDADVVDDVLQGGPVR